MPAPVRVLPAVRSGSARIPVCGGAVLRRRGGRQNVISAQFKLLR